MYWTASSWTISDYISNLLRFSYFAFWFFDFFTLPSDSSIFLLSLLVLQFFLLCILILWFFFFAFFSPGSSLARASPCQRRGGRRGRSLRSGGQNWKKGTSTSHCFGLVSVLYLSKGLPYISMSYPRPSLYRAQPWKTFQHELITADNCRWDP